MDGIGSGFCEVKVNTHNEEIFLIKPLFTPELMFEFL